MDLAIAIQRQYSDELNKLMQIAVDLDQARGKQKPELEKQLKCQINLLLARIQNDFPERLTQNLVLTILYQHFNLVNETTANEFRSLWQQRVIMQQRHDSLRDESVNNFVLLAKIPKGVCQQFCAFSQNP